MEIFRYLPSNAFNLVLQYTLHMHNRYAENEAILDYPPFQPLPFYSTISTSIQSSTA